MSRILHFVFATILTAFIARPAPAEAEISLISAWQHCEPMKGCMKFAFMPNGHVIEQFPLAGSVVTAYGRYHIRGTVLKIGWKRFEPIEICAAGVDSNAEPDSRCMSTAQVDIKGPFHFMGINALLWTAPGAPPLRLVRIEL